MQEKIKVSNAYKAVNQFNSRSVYSYIFNNGGSALWRADWAKFAGKTMHRSFSITSISKQAQKVM